MLSFLFSLFSLLFSIFSFLFSGGRPKCDSTIAERTDSLDTISDCVIKLYQQLATENSIKPNYTRGFGISLQKLT